MVIDESVFKSKRWRSDVVTEGALEWRRDFREDVLVQILVRPKGHTQWQKPIDLLSIRPT